MRLRNLFCAVALAIPLLLLVACGSDPQTTAGDAERLARTPVPTTNTSTSPAAGATADGSAEPAPVLGGNVTDVTPPHGSKIRQVLTTSPDPNNPRGTCAKVDFTDLPENFQWFRMVFDSKEVTSQLVLIPNSATDPTGGAICYSPVKGFTVGHHIVAVSVQSPRDPSATTRQIVEWSFDVTP